MRIHEIITESREENFKRWFGNSKVVDGSGRPLIMYRGDKENSTYGQSGIAKTQGIGIFVTPSPESASQFAIGNKSGNRSGGFLVPVYVKSERPFDYDNQQHINMLLKYLLSLDEDDIEYLLSETNNDTIEDLLNEIASGDENWSALELPEIWNWIIKNFDGAYIGEGGIKNLAVFSPSQIKSATGNNGEFNPNNPDITKE